VIVDESNKHLYELYSVWFDGTTWNAFSGAFFDMNTDDRRPEGWTSADAAGLAILPGLIRYDEAFSGDPIRHAFRVTASATNGHVYPASHTAGSNPAAPPMGARFRLKASTDISGFAPHIQRILQAMKTYGLIVADNGSNMFITGTYDPQWDSMLNGDTVIDGINSAFGQIHASDFEVVQLGYNPPAGPSLSIGDVSVTEGDTGTTQASFPVTLSAAASGTVTVSWATANGTATAGSDYTAASGTITFNAGETAKTAVVNVLGDSVDEPDETFMVNLSSPSGATIADGQATGTILDNDPPPQVSVGDAIVTEGNSGTASVAVGIQLSAPSAFPVTVSYATASSTAAMGSDFVASSGTVTVPAGSTSTSVTVSVIGDLVDERNEAFLITLGSPVNATLGRAVGQVTIIDDDGRPGLCLPIVVLPYTITAQGNYCLVQNLSTAQPSGNAITVASDFVSIDLKGFKIGGGAAGPGTQTNGVYAQNRKNVTVKNGNIRGFLRAVFLQDTSGTFTTSQGHLVEAIRADGNTYVGIHVQGRGSSVRNNQVVATTGTTVFGVDSTTFGILSEGPGARILNNDVTDTFGVGAGEGRAVAVSSADGTVIDRNRIGNSVFATAVGIRIVSSSDVLAMRNRLAVLPDGIVYDSSTGLYRSNLTSGVTNPYVGGTDAGKNQ
jgi:Calx-beta domain